MKQRYEDHGRTTHPTLPISYSVFSCRDCGSLVASKQAHDDFHALLEKIAEGARYGSMLRPIG